ncbi:PKD domain-containing protein [Botryobacter ruber]|uniref:PKD domain-containing protein n=1 Tax=Botryobacter ruber TaxID=2171629 RepID=UPI000E0C9C98|nr:PKD domain-containing protein [Botryobacter ruber]
MKRTISFPRLIKYLPVALLTLVAAACSPDDPDLELGPPPSSDSITIIATPSSSNPNIVQLKSEAPGAFKSIWDLGNGVTAEGQQVNASYALEGEYTVKLTVFTKNGFASNTKTIRIDQTNFSMLDRPDYNALTGGADKLAGKTWVFDPVGPMNFGGPADAPNSWWNQTLAEQNDCMKDDKYVFKLDGFKFENQSNGAMWGIADGAENVCVPQPATAPASSWNLYEENGKTMLSLSNNETIAWDDNEGVYEVIELTENRLYIRKTCCGGAGTRNYVLVPEGYTPPVEVIEKPYKIEDIRDNFDAPGNIIWIQDAMTLMAPYDNPAPLPINTSPKVAMYIKQEGQPFAFANLFTDLEYKMDLRQRNVFKLKVFIPSYNDFVTAAGEDWAIKTLLKQVSVKLQDGSAAQPWANQVEVKQAVSQTDKWVELTFDFSPYADRTDLDRIVVQIGGEGNYIPAIFFLDDFRLEP